VLVAIRPEGFSLSLTPSAEAAVAGRLIARQYLGGRQLLQVAIDGRAAPVAVAAFAQRGDDSWEGREDQPVWLGLRPDALTVLDHE
jgi:ABC-type Fe3+/spermidine/putrescine transport system ATPase subunit